MFIELTQLSYDPQKNVWVDLKTTLTSRAVVGFYPHPEYEGVLVVLLADQSSILVRESYSDLRDLLVPVPKKEFKVEPNVWIPVEEHLPTKDDSYLVTTNRLSYALEIGIFKDGKWRVPPGVRIVAWMEIPKPSWYRNYQG